ncbi:MAG: GNAT family N-acetyltransferase [Acidimicrobiia bacterium]
MNSTDALGGYPDHLDPISPHTGPFPHSPFIGAVHRRLAPKSSELLVEQTTEGAVALKVDQGIVRFAAEEYVTDYHSPLGPDGTGALAKAIASAEASAFDFDSLPIETKDAVLEVLNETSAASTVEIHAATGVLSLPPSFDDWLASIGKKERHETRRKRRKLVNEFGDFEIVSEGADGVDAFCTLHRTAAGDKGGFMTDTRQAYFTDLVTHAGAVIHNLVCDGRTLASAFGFETADAYYFYNSAFDADVRQVSPGAVLLGALIEGQIERGATVFDFLKGAETYKYRHGAQPRDLYRVSGAFRD